MDDDSILSHLEEDEMERPITRKVLANRNIYNSRPVPPCMGLPVLSDLGEARIGSQKHKGDIMPGINSVSMSVTGLQPICQTNTWLGLGFTKGKPPVLRKEKSYPR